MSTPGLPHFLRSAAVSSTILCLGIGSHVLAGGTLPALPILVLMGALLLLPVAALSRQRRSRVSLAALMGGGQLALHEGLSAFSSAAICSSGTVHAGHYGAAPISCQTSTAPLAVDEPTTVLLMLLAHLLATGVLVLMLGHGEAALELLRAWLRPLSQQPAPAVVVPVPPISTVSRSVFTPLPRHYAAVPALRGPPQRSFPHTSDPRTPV
ncbi:hypothetical protein [Arthrobacter sp. H41]|uniref:hypothetical protein n=1 Tax=Arthrobacter sp. H41 TaxID=1312978 RepID=UPI0004B386CB|nr:hypothetical protein [Arthrobacter sp. H41]